MKKQEGFGLIGVLIILGTLVITMGGVFVWQRKTLPALTPTSTPVPEPISISCQTDSDCPAMGCAQGCPVEGPCPPCPQNKCVNGKCQKVYPDYSESLDKKVQLSPGQTASIKNTNLSCTLLKIAMSQRSCFTCPVDTEIEVRSGGRIEKIVFRTPGIATKEWGTHRIKETFGFQIRLESVQPELIILSVQKL